MKRIKPGGKKKHETKSSIESLRHCKLSGKMLADTNKMVGKTFKKVGRINNPGDGLAKWRKR